MRKAATIAYDLLVYLRLLKWFYIYFYLPLFVVYFYLATTADLFIGVLTTRTQTFTFGGLYTNFKRLTIHIHHQIHALVPTKYKLLVYILFSFDSTRFACLFLSMRIGISFFSIQFNSISTETIYTQTHYFSNGNRITF